MSDHPFPGQWIYNVLLSLLENELTLKAGIGDTLGKKKKKVRGCASLGKREAGGGEGMLRKGTSASSQDGLEHEKIGANK